MAKQRYSVVVESGSCSSDYRRWEERVNCGHSHKTIKAAAQCLSKLTRMYCEHGRIAGQTCRLCLGGLAHGHNTSAKWYNACIHNTCGERLTDEQGQEQYQAELEQR